jgi:hypothetical protein
MYLMFMNKIKNYDASDLDQEAEEVYNVTKKTITTNSSHKNNNNRKNNKNFYI